MSLRVTAVALIGYDHDHLEQILRDYIAKSYQPEEIPARAFALDLLEKIEASKYVEASH